MRRNEAAMFQLEDGCVFPLIHGDFGLASPLKPRALKSDALKNQRPVSCPAKSSSVDESVATLAITPDKPKK
jgi:hypothetical protein